MQEHEALSAQAREAWVQQGLYEHWDYWVRLGEAHREGAVEQHRERFIADLRRTSPGIRLLAGIDTEPYPHVHLVLKLSRRLRRRFINAAEVQAWIQLFWPHGPVWLEAFDCERLIRDHHAGGGALRYIGKDPGTLVSL